MDKNKIEEIILKLDESIKNYATIFGIEKIDVDLQTNNESKITYERTISSYSNSTLSKLIESYFSSKISLYANEFQIYLKNGIDTTTFAKMRGDLHLDSDDKEKKWNYCVVDGYFKFEYEDTIKHLFVEYKLNDKYEYAELALDFLKYKCYTKINESNTYFAFVICKKQENYPSIIDNLSKLFKEIDSTLSATDLNEYRVFIYEGKSSKDSPAPSEELIGNLQDMVTGLNTLEDKMNFLSDNERTILNGMKNYNSRVIKAYLIRKNSSYIFAAYKYLIENKVFDQNVIGSFYLPGNKLNLKLVVDEGSTYNNNIINIFGTQGKIDSAKEAVRGSPYVSLYMLTFIHYFCNKYAPNFDNKCDFGTYSTGKGKYKQVFEYEEAVKNLEKKISTFYMNDNKEFEKLSKLVFSLLSYLTFVLPLLYILDENHEVKDENKTLKNEKNLQGVFDIYKRINVLEKLQIKKINFYDFVPEYPVHLNELFYKLIKKY